MYVGCIRFDFWKTTIEVSGQLQLTFFSLFQLHAKGQEISEEVFFLSSNRPMKLFTNLHHHHFLKVREEICETIFFWVFEDKKNSYEISWPLHASWCREEKLYFLILFISQKVNTTTFSSCKMIPFMQNCLRLLLTSSSLAWITQEYRTSKKEFSTSYMFEKQGTSEGCEWYQIDHDPKWSRESVKLIWNQFWIFQNLQRFSVPQTNTVGKW